jgi:hypothetical protein
MFRRYQSKLEEAIEKAKLENAIQNTHQRDDIKALFRDYSTAFKRIRNPTKTELEEYQEMHIKYADYMCKENIK